LAAYVPGFGEWFDDHFGMRSALVRWYGETRLFLWESPRRPPCTKGRNGFFFYADDNATEDFASADPLTPEAIGNWRSAISKAHRWLRSKQIGYVFTLAPDKHAIYPKKCRHDCDGSARCREPISCTAASTIWEFW
jgi:hypothetical protein